MNICFFGDQKVSRFHPLTLTRPMDDLRVGLFTIREKWQKMMGAQQSARLEPKHLQGVFKRGHVSRDAFCLWINSRFLPNRKLVEEINRLEIGEKLMCNGDMVAAKISGPKSSEYHEQNKLEVEDLHPVKTNKCDQLEYLWDIISKNPAQIREDSHLISFQNIGRTGLGIEAVVQYTSNIFIEEGVHIEPGCIFIGKDGPIIIRKGAIIEAGSTIRGPVAIGEGATVKTAARIYGGTTVGPVCKVGGEVSGCVFHSYTNKAHDGFAGNSIFGQWVNLGANTVTSNLKNDYKNIRVRDWLTKEPVETGRQFLGTIMADHSKTAINTMLNTGAICGVSSNVFIDVLSPKLIESFTWLGPNGPAEYRFDKAVQVMEAMMDRREVKLTDEYRAMMRGIFENR